MGLRIFIEIGESESEKSEIRIRVRVSVARYLSKRWKILTFHWTTFEINFNYV